MVDNIGGKMSNRSGRGSFGRKSRELKFSGERQNQIKAHTDAKTLRDKARMNILNSRATLKQILIRNEAQTKKKLSQRRKNINPLFFPLTTKFERRYRPTLTHSTVPKKPKYSLIEPKERMYGAKWSKISNPPQRVLHPAIKKAVEEIQAGIEQKKAEIAEAVKKQEG